MAPILMMLEVAMDLMQPRMVERIVDVGIANLDMHVVWSTGLTMFGLAVLGAFGGMVNGLCAEMAIQGFGRDLRDALFRKVQAYSFANLDEIETGQLITRLTNDVTQVQEAIYMSLRMLVRAPLLLIGSLVMAIVTSPQLTFLPLILMPIELAFVILVIKRATPLFNLMQQKLDKLNGVMQENLAGVRVVKAFVRMAHEQKRFGAANTELTDTGMHAGRTMAVVPPFMMMTMNLGIIGVLWFGGVNVVQGTMQVGQIIAFVNYLGITLFSLMMVSQLVMMLARASASVRRIQEVLDRQPTVQDAADAKQDVVLRGQVRFEDVTFGYQANGGEPVLRGVNFSAQPGQMVALLGTTGSGKTSLVNLIPRFYDVSSGRVLVDEMDVRTLSQKALRHNIGMALQETVLFSGTIRDNIRYGKPDATDEEVIAAAQAAEAHDFISGFPDGYDTAVGQRGVNLSGGQKQRIAIARAILAKPPILILDDSTSAVDVDTEARIQAALQEVMHTSTSFVIAQRISTVLAADKILVLDDGHIVAEGTHEELMTSSPIYKDIYQSQLGNGVAA
ncbi:MAG: ABC transporter ATP-binding protein/permease [Chloroflexi bacterium]|nr:ABC transporter ATP-binding protein/permease [Chloroflexota bacterium]